MAPNSGNLNQSAIGLRTLSTISDNKPSKTLGQEKPGGMNERGPSLLLGGLVLDTLDLEDNTDLAKKRFSMSREWDEQSKKPALTSKFSGQSSGSSEEEKTNEIKTIKEWKNSRIVHEEWDEEDEKSPNDLTKRRIDLEETGNVNPLKNILKRNLSDD